jgi:hypothetical protein
LYDLIQSYISRGGAAYKVEITEATKAAKTPPPPPSQPQANAASPSHSTKLFKNHCRILCEPFFDPLRNERGEASTPVRERAGLMHTYSTTPTSVHSPTRTKQGSPGSASGKTPKRASLSRMFASLTSPSQDPFKLRCDNETLVNLHADIGATDVDLGRLWADAKVAEEIETRRLLGKLARAGLF